MATYDEWNKAIAEYFVSGLASGATVYLSVDEDALMDIGRRFEQLETDNINWVDNFKQAVRAKCVIGNTVHLPWVYEYKSDEIPRCVAFLASMVLAAHYMISGEIENETILQTNYFKRLREVLGLPIEDGKRPEGLLPYGVEENLWQTWNRWLIGKGWLHSAEQGQSNYNKYINYPLSQALLREADQIVLERLFRQQVNLGQLSRVCDRDTISFWVRNQHFGSKHLRDLIQDSERYDVITDTIYDVYLSIDWDQEMETERYIRSLRQRRMTAHLYRVEDGIMGDIEYYLYPRQPMKFGGGSLEIVHNGSIHPLREERQGWFMPLWPVDPAGGMLYEVRGHSQIKELVLPERNFWILVRDPKNEASGVFAEWGHPGLGETFILLCRKEYTEQMELFRQEDLINWDHDFPIDDEWIEYRECMITSQSWKEIIPIPQYEDLYDILKPSFSATISLKGGLRVPNQGGWLEGYAPETTIIAFDDRVNLKLMDTSLPDDPIMNQSVETNKPISVPSLTPGVYLFEVYTLGKLVPRRRSLQILPWDSLDCSQPKQPFDVNVGTFTQQGAVVKMNETSNNGEE